jgi:hypothetical protein
VGHQKAGLGRSEELARALARAFGELAQQVFAGATEEVRLHVGEPQAVAQVGEGLHHAAQLGRVDVALAVALGGEVHHVDDARERGVLFDHMRAGLAPVDHRPPGFERQIESQ